MFPRSTRHSVSWIFSLLALGIVGPIAAADPGYYRFPAPHGDTLVFTAEGDLWTTSASGGIARRLTTHAAEESQAAVSPDGEWVAFAASYDSAIEAYVMPLDGGAPRRLSFDGGRVWIQGWTPQGEVLYASEAQAGPGGRRVLRAIDPRTRALRTLPLDDATEAAIDPSTGVVYFTRLGLLMTNDNARLYRGGALARIWRYDPATGAEATRVVPAGAASLVDSAQARPMWWNGRLYFVSDSDGTHNLWSMRPDGTDPRQLTRHQGWDVRGARLEGGHIAYQLGADLRWFDIASGTDRALPIQLASDFEQRRERHRKQPLEYLTSVTFGGAGDHLLLTTRGLMAKVQPGPERRVEIAAPRSSRSRAGVLSVDGKWVYAIHDAGGEQEIWRFAADGRGDAEALTHDGAIHRWRLVPSPDGRWLAHDDKRGRLWLLDLETRENRELDRGPQVGDDVYADIVWSPDSKTLALVRPDSPRLLNQVLLYSLAERRVHRLTSDRYPSFAPAFSRDGRWLYFLSNRNFEANPSAPWGDRNMGPAFDRRTRIYAYALQSGQRFPFQVPDELASDEKPPTPPADEKKAESEAKAASSDSEPKAAKGAKDLPAIQWTGLEDRLYEVPAEAGNYAALAADADRLYVLDENSGPDASPDLKTLALKSDSPDFETFAKSVREFALSADAKKLYYRTFSEEGPGDLYVVAAGAKAPEGAALKKGLVRVGDWTLTIDPVQEWRQMFVDAWRMHRDFAFDARLRGVDWKAVRTKYEPFVERITDRGELDDLLGQMTGEIGILHSQVRGAEIRKDGEAATFAGLGARLSRQPGGARVERIYRTEVELPGERGPLSRPGVDVREGDVITAVNGRTLDGVADISELLENQAGQQVLLTLRRGTRDVRAVVVPVNGAREVALRYSDWVQGTRARVEEAAAGRIGYLHLRAMGGADVTTFVRDFYANVGRQGLILDVRRNRGGNIESWVIEKLLRRTWAFWTGAEQGPPTWNMQQTFRGHLVVLIDQLTYSDGETFAAGVKALGLGPLLGTRTAGAGVWLSDRNSLADRGSARVAEFAQFTADGRWIIEGRGVAPDIEVDNPPHASFEGHDAQLEAAIAYLEKKIAESPVVDPKPQEIPPLGETGAER